MSWGMVYFQEHTDRDWIRIGYAGRPGRENSTPDFTPVALVPATQDDEKALHAHFGAYRVKRKGENSTYQGDEVTNYVAWLLERNLAGRNRAEAGQMPRLPWAVWNPATQINEGRHGELTLFAALAPRERIAYARSDLAHLSSESDDWYTPPDIIDAARRAMGSIDLDPATSAEVNRSTIHADLWYTKDHDGLRTDLPWRGNVWLNPPYGRGESSAAAFTDRLIRELMGGNVTQAVTCLNVLSITALWFLPIWRTASCHAVSRGRPNFWNPGQESSSPTKGTVLSYFGPHPKRFIEEFRAFGTIIQTVDNP